MGGNYPPGVNDGHPHFNPPDRSHDHEFEPDELMYPIFEDCAAIFVEVCQWAPLIASETDYHRDETYEEYGEPCGEQRSIRFEPSLIHNSQNGTVYGKQSFENDDGELVEDVEQALHDIEGKNNRSDEVGIITCDPDPDGGSLLVVINNFRIKYVPVPQTNREAD